MAPPPPFAWSATLQPSEIALEHFAANGVPAIPVAFLPPAEFAIRLKNPKLILDNLQQVTSHYRDVTEVKQFGKNGIVCRSRNLSCVSDLLGCTSFAGIPVRPFIPQHLACVKGVIRGLDSSMDATEVLDQLSDLGVVEVYRCSVVKDGQRLATETCIATFAGTSCPSELKIWPLIFRVDRYIRKPQQCQQCLRYGHSQRVCKSDIRCKRCAQAHSILECSASEPHCALCENAHSADSETCPARIREIEIIQVMENTRCSHGEAWEVVKQKSRSFSATLLQPSPATDASLRKLIDASVEKSISRAMDRLLDALVPALTNVLTEKLSTALDKVGSLTTVPAQSTREGAFLPSPLSTGPASTSCSTSGSGDSEKMDIATISQKRRVTSSNNPRSPSGSSGRKDKKKSKGVKDVLAEAVSSILPLSPEHVSPP